MRLTRASVIKNNSMKRVRLLVEAWDAACVNPGTIVEPFYKYLRDYWKRKGTFDTHHTTVLCFTTITFSQAFFSNNFTCRRAGVSERNFVKLFLSLFFPGAAFISSLFWYRSLEATSCRFPLIETAVYQFKDFVALHKARCKIYFVSVQNELPN